LGSLLVFIFRGIFQEIGVLAEFFADFGRNPRLWVKIGGWYVILRCLGNVDKIKTSKNEHKLT
jgi:hypothetical protein